MDVNTDALAVALNQVNRELRSTCSLLGEMRGSISMTLDLVNTLCDALLESQMLMQRTQEMQKELT